MAGEKQAAAEGILERIWREELSDLDLLLHRTGDVQFWADVMRYELDLEALMTKGLLRSDATLISLRDFNVHSMSPFHYAGLRGAERVIRRGLQVGLNVEVGLRNGTSVLHLASFAGQMETVELLVDEFKANVNREDGYRCCPLHYASAQGHQRVVEFLVSRGADIDARDSEGATAAYHARKHRQQHIVSYLLDISGDGDILLVEEQSLADEVRTAARIANPMYTAVCKTNKKRLPVLDYEEVELSSEGDNMVGTVKGSQDAGDRRPSDENADSKKTGKRMIYENTEFKFALASPLETGGHASAKDMSSRDEKRHVWKTPNDSATTNISLSERAALDRCDESNEVAKYNLQPGRRQHCYKEVGLQLSHDSATDPTLPYGYASVEDSTNITKGGINRRDHRKIEVPSDTMPHSEIGLYNRNSCRENVKSNEIDDSFNGNHQYDELNISSGSADNDSNTSKERATREEIIPTIDMSKFVRRPHPYEEIKLPCDEDPNKMHLDEHQLVEETFVRRPHPYEEIKFPCGEDPNKIHLDEHQLVEETFVRRPHPYEEIKFPCDEDPNKIHPGEHQVEQNVRQLLRTEMKKLELVGNAVDVENSIRCSDKDFNGSDAIRKFFNVSEMAEDVPPDRHYDMTAVITLRQLQRVLREEFGRFGNQLRLTEPHLKTIAKSNETLKIDRISTSSPMPTKTGLYDELTICSESGSEVGQIETIEPAASREVNPIEDIDRKERKRDDSPPTLPQRTDKRKPEIAEQTNKGSKLNFDPTILRKDHRNRKERGKESTSPRRSPLLRLKTQKYKVQEASDSKNEQKLQNSDEAKAGRSEFYVSLAHSKAFSEI